MLCFFFVLNWPACLLERAGGRLKPGSCIAFTVSVTDPMQHSFWSPKAPKAECVFVPLSSVRHCPDVHICDDLSDLLPTLLCVCAFYSDSHGLVLVSTKRLILLSCVTPATRGVGVCWSIWPVFFSLLLTNSMNV